MPLTDALRVCHGHVVEGPLLSSLVPGPRGAAVDRGLGDLTREPEAVRALVGGAVAVTSRGRAVI